MKFATILACLAMAACGGDGYGKSDKAPQDRASAPRSAAPAGDPDKFFMHCAALANLSEVEAGRIAADRARDPEVKKFGKQMVQDHTRAQSELTELAGRKGATLPVQPDPASAEAVAHLSKLPAADFDREYLGMMVAEHAKAVAIFESKSKHAKDADLKAWAGKTLTGLKHHLETAKSLADRVSAAPEGAR